MNYLYALIVIVVLSLIYIGVYYLNSKIKVDCDKSEMCDNCSIESCYHKINKED